MQELDELETFLRVAERLAKQNGTMSSEAQPSPVAMKVNATPSAADEPMLLTADQLILSDEPIDLSMDQFDLNEQPVRQHAIMVAPKKTGAEWQAAYHAERARRTAAAV